MTTNDAFESALTGAFGRLADGAPVDADPITMVTVVARRPPIVAPSRFDLREHRSLALAVAMLLLLLVASVVGSFVGARPMRLLATDEPTTTPSLAPPIPYQGAFVKVDELAGSELLGDTLVRLADGRILVLRDSWPNRMRAALFDPTTGRVAPSEFTVGKRSGPVAVLLRDGRVLIIGGDIRSTSETGGVATYSTAEIYDPNGDYFKAAGSMVGKGWAPSATLLADGRVLVLDGISVDDADAPDPLLTTAEVYDPATDTFTATSPMSIGRGPTQMAVLHDGRVLVVGGRYPETGIAELFDPTTGRFHRTGSLPSVGQHPFESQVWPQVAAGAITLADGRVLIPGRHCDEIQPKLEGGYPTSAAIFDPATESFSASAAMPHCVDQATALPDGRVFLTGFWGSANWSGIYDPASDSVTQTAAPPAGRYMEEVGLADGGVLVVWGDGAEIFR